MKYFYLFFQVLGGTIFYLSIKMLCFVGFKEFAEKCMMATIDYKGSGFKAGIRTLAMQMLYTKYVKEHKYERAEEIIDLISADHCGSNDAMQKYMELAEIAHKQGKTDIARRIKGKITEGKT